MKLASHSEISAARWDACYERSRQAWLFHSHAWVTLEHKHGAKEQHSFGIVDADGEVLAIVPLYVYELGLGFFTERVLASGLRVAGIAIRDDVVDAARTAVQRRIMQEILRIADARDCDRIQLGMHTLAPACLDKSGPPVPFWLREHGFEPGIQMGPNGMAPAPGMSTHALDQVVELDSDLQALEARFDPACRRALRKARRAALTGETAAGRAGVERYYALATKSAARTGESLAPLAYFADLVDTFAPVDKLHLIFTRFDDADAAALILLVDKGSASFLAGVSDPEMLGYRVNDFLHYSAIELAKSLGAQRYRLGPIFPTLPLDWPVSRVSRFKKKFAGHSLPVVQGSFFRHPERYLEVGEQILRLNCHAGDDARNAQPEPPDLTSASETTVPRPAPAMKRSTLKRMLRLGLGSHE
ncbi:MAG: GNAT family N-acetyltransferase [Gammaproteobacteria bacterium]|nr:GNAT family N-acetyltransferase [Gammaproteobacteria bacterium]